jgi:hypothetical protein
VSLDGAGEGDAEGEHGSVGEEGGSHCPPVGKLEAGSGAKGWDWERKMYPRESTWSMWERKQCV